MRFLKDEQILTMRGQELLIQEFEGPLAGTHTIGSLSKAFVEAHNNQSGLNLSVDDFRNYMKLEDVFNAGSQNGWYQFEDASFDLLIKIVEALAPKALIMTIARNSPVIMDMLKDATRRVPPELEKPSTNSHQEGVEVGVID